MKRNKKWMSGRISGRVAKMSWERRREVREDGGCKEEEEEIGEGAGGIGWMLSCGIPVVGVYNLYGGFEHTMVLCG
jgi:hypothetical protein